MTISIENEHARYVINANGTNRHFIDKRTGVDYYAPEPGTSFARVKKLGQAFNASTATYANNQITVHFGESGVSTVVGVAVKADYICVGSPVYRRRTGGGIGLC
jgi:hypothetical protein